MKRSNFRTSRLSPHWANRIKTKQQIKRRYDKKSSLFVGVEVGANASDCIARDRIGAVILFSCTRDGVQLATLLLK
jgi:hypothetical protein